MSGRARTAGFRLGGFAAAAVIHAVEPECMHVRGSCQKIGAAGRGHSLGTWRLCNCDSLFKLVGIFIHDEIHTRTDLHDKERQGLLKTFHVRRNVVLSAQEICGEIVKEFCDLLSCVHDLNMVCPEQNWIAGSCHSEMCDVLVDAASFRHRQESAGSSKTWIVIRSDIIWASTSCEKFIEGAETHEG
jgi:hypothetical protein